MSANKNLSISFSGDRTSALMTKLLLENELLKKKLAIKEEGNGWQKEEAQRLRDSGMSIRKIAEITGVSKSNVAKYTKPKGTL